MNYFLLIYFEFISAQTTQKKISNDKEFYATNPRKKSYYLLRLILNKAIYHKTSFH